MSGESTYQKLISLLLHLKLVTRHVIAARGSQCLLPFLQLLDRPGGRLGIVLQSVAGTFFGIRFGHALLHDLLSLIS